MKISSINLLIIALFFQSGITSSAHAGGLTGSSSTTSSISTPDSSSVLKLEPDSMEQRRLQTRKYDDITEAKVISASLQVLQDLGFNIDSSEAKLGVIQGSKDRDATEAGQVVGSIIFAIIFGAALPIKKKKKMLASIVVSPAPSQDKANLVRVTFSRLVWNTENTISKAERLNAPEIYQEFFDRLSKSLFLEAQQI